MINLLNFVIVYEQKYGQTVIRVSEQENGRKTATFGRKHSQRARVMDLERVRGYRPVRESRLIAENSETKTPSWINKVVNKQFKTGRGPLYTNHQPSLNSSYTVSNPSNISRKSIKSNQSSYISKLSQEHAEARDKSSSRIREQTREIIKKSAQSRRSNNSHIANIKKEVPYQPLHQHKAVKKRSKAQRPKQLMSPRHQSSQDINLQSCQSNLNLLTKNNQSSKYQLTKLNDVIQKNYGSDEKLSKKKKGKVNSNRKYMNINTEGANRERIIGV